MLDRRSSWLRASAIIAVIVAILTSALYLENSGAGEKLQEPLQESLEYGSAETIVPVNMGSCRLVANLTKKRRSMTLTTSMVRIGVNGTMLGGEARVTTTSVAEKPLPLVEYECNGSHHIKSAWPTDSQCIAHRGEGSGV